ncbi:MAG: VTT domain-containing protein [Gemmatimonadetes bacterium]|nr:VTT domain-containing protein [Gemmatimonadota bacterium]
MKAVQAAILVAALAASAATCAAPAAEQATGPIAAAVEQAMRSGTRRFDHSDWDRLLREGTRDGLADYAYMAAHRGDLDAYASRIGAADLPTLQSDELKALLVNAYNALTVIAILDHPGVSSIRDIDGVWTELTWSVGGYDLTLDNIEHNVLRPFFKDPRIHFAVNCASMSCAPLTPWAYTGAELESQLEERSRAFLTDPRNVQLEGASLRVSRYFDWYGDDFVTDGWHPVAPSIAEFIAIYADDEVGAAIAADPAISIAFRDYDWSLNAVEAPTEISSSVAEPVFAAVALPQDAATGVARWVERLREWVSGFGMAGPLVYGLVYALAVVFLAPASALTSGAGVAFGLGVGTATVVLSATVGASLAFLIGRYLLRSRVERWLSGRAKLSAIDRAVESQGWRVVALTRLSPAFPFNVQNYFYGLTGVGFWHYAIASLFAMAPGTLLYVYIGVAGAEVAEATGGAASWGRTALLVAGLVATLLVVVVITRVAKRELDKAVAEGGAARGPSGAAAAG